MYISNLPDRRATAIYSLSIILGLFLYFSSTDSYKGWWIALEQYSSFSRHIYEPNTAYYAESILVPFLASLLDANQTREAYNTLCGFMTIAVLPLLARGLMARIRNISHVLVILCVYAASFIYLRDFWLGYPDPLTIILLNFAALSLAPLRVFLFVLLASLAHFSLTAASVISLMAVYYASSRVPRSMRPKLMLGAGLGLVGGKMALLLWYHIFSYKLADRIDFVTRGKMSGLLDGVMAFYIDYAKSIFEFWTTPGFLFIGIATLMVFFFATRGRYLFSAALFFSVTIAYAVRFITTDGLRDFATTVSAAYIFSLCEFFHAWQAPQCFSKCIRLPRPSRAKPACFRE
ncbi:hypothetical protein [Solidesulfovibrio sp.]